LFSGDSWPALFFLEITIDSFKSPSALLPVMTPTETAQIKKRLTKLERAIAKLQQQRADPDTILTAADRKALAAYEREERSGTLVDGEQLRRELRL